METRSVLTKLDPRLDGRSRALPRQILLRLDAVVVSGEVLRTVLDRVTDELRRYARDVRSLTRFRSAAASRALRHDLAHLRMLLTRAEGQCPLCC